MAHGGRVGKFPYEIIGDQRLPLRVVLTSVSKCRRKRSEAIVILRLLRFGVH